MEKCGCGRLIRVLCFFVRVVVGVSCSVVGPKRYERWGVILVLLEKYVSCWPKICLIFETMLLSRTTVAGGRALLPRVFSSQAAAEVTNNAAAPATPRSEPDGLGRVVVISSGKGGVGKTTCAASFSYGLAKRGLKTVVVDFDIGLRNLGESERNFDPPPSAAPPPPPPSISEISQGARPGDPEACNAWKPFVGCGPQATG